MSINPTSYYKNNSITFIQLPLELWLKQLIERKDEKLVLTFLKQNQFYWNEELVKFSIENSWDDVLDFLFQKGVDFVPYLTKAIDDKNSHALEKLTQHYIQRINELGYDNTTLLSYALDVENFEAADFLIKSGAKINQPLKLELESKIYRTFKLNFFENKSYFGKNGDILLDQIVKTDFQNSLAYAIIFYYYPKNKEALNLLINHPQYISMQVIKAAIILGDAEAFKQLIAPFLKSCTDVEQTKGQLLNYVLGGTHFSLMGFNFDYILQRAEILKTISVLNPSTKTLNKHNMSSFEIAQYLKTFFPGKLTPEFEAFFSKILNDPTGFHEVWEIQRLLINSFGIEIPMKNFSKLGIAAYPSVYKHFKESVAQFSQQNHLSNEWVFVAPSKDFTLDDCLKMIEKKKIVKFFTGWTNGCDNGHGINVVVYDKYLFVCNRGNGATEMTLGICIYEIGDPSTLKEIVELSLERSQKTQDFFTKTVNTHPSIHLLKHVYRKSQVVPNCVYLSDKMGVYACDIAEFLKKGLSLKEATLHGTEQFKKRSKFERLNLISAYLNHPYHLRSGEESQIFLAEIMSSIIARNSKKINSAALNLVLQKLSNDSIKKALGASYRSIYIEAVYSQFANALAEGNAQDAVKILDLFQNAEETQNEPILLTNLISLIVEKSSTKIRAIALDIVLKKLNEDWIKKALGPSYQSLYIGTIASQFDNALAEGSTKAAIKILDLFPNVNVVIECFSTTLLHLACRHCNLEVAQELIKKNADPNLICCNSSPLGEIIDSEVLEKSAIAKYMIKMTDLNRLAAKNNFPLHRAIKKEFEFAVCEIVKKGFDLNLPDRDGNTIFHHAAQSKSESMTKYVFSLCEDLNIKNKRNQTPLHLAAKGTLHAVKTLLELGADLNAQTVENYFPFDSVFVNGQVEICKLLIKKGVNINYKRSDYGCSPLMHFINCESEDLVDVLLNTDKIDVNLKDVFNNTALSLAVSKGMNNVIEKLLNMNADLKLDEGNTLLHLAVTSNKPATCKFLLSLGFDKNAKNEQGQIPLDLARKHEYVEVMDVLSN